MKSVRRPWGGFDEFVRNRPMTVKLLYIKKGHRLSYQYHRHRSEFWRVVSGRIVVTLDGTKLHLGKGDSAHVPRRARHRIEAKRDAVILEIATGKFDEEDIVRLEDDYGRLPPRTRSHPGLGPRPIGPVRA